MDAIVFEPLDVVSVRDARSFDAGGASVARALWPPTPWTFLGAIRAGLVRAMGLDPSVYGGRGWTGNQKAPEGYDEAFKVLGNPWDVPGFQIGPAILFDESSRSALFPVPADITGREPRGLSRLRPEPVERRFGAIRTSPSAYPDVLLPDEAERPAKERGVQQLNRAEAEEWLSGRVPSDAKRREFTPVCSERRIGIAIDPATGTVRTGMFYQRKAFSLRSSWVLVVPVLNPGTALEAFRQVGGVSELGGDRHAVRLRRISDFDWPKTTASGPEAVLWFLSPVRASDVSPQALSQKGMEVLAIVADRPVRLGGWRMWRGQSGIGGPRGMRRYHPAGTCVYVRALAEPAWSDFHGQSLAQDAEERAAGFGVCLVGAWPRP